MRILITNNHLVRFGGTERWVESIWEELKACGHDVHVFAIEVGPFAVIFGDDLVSKPEKQYDLILCNHNSTLRYLRGFGVTGFKVYTCHGFFHPLETPEQGADWYAYVSAECREKMMKRTGIDGDVIMNGINHNKFRDNSGEGYVAIATKGVEAQTVVKGICDSLGIRSLIVGESGDEICDLMGNARMVVGIGRTAMEAAMCNKPVLLFDSRDYMGWFLAGEMNVEYHAGTNFSGRDGIKNPLRDDISHDLAEIYFNGKTNNRFDMIDNGHAVCDVAKRYIAFLR